MKTIIIKDLINHSLESNFAAYELFDVINQCPEEDIIIDFTDVTFISRSFAQAYFSKKIKCGKNINEINLSGEAKDFFNTIRRNFE
ncbi:MAG: DUF4325 domain-containing protein [Methanobrevibacter sp.]|uniref:DUF4325 domain-containing protein n=1 Tax=Methanobrevibacter millerae TaxID=230361 RepID=A0A8T3VKM2_9EURY|nr:hypothetical protein [Methanobrevibacter millerae]MBE6505783.1 hypothetical protein [Methanobrevibacter millerae]MBR0059381.1 DUF4325 domain-containing protein [Methanobrevibacter sp.]MBR0370549.1 DUF4325 domain-containing protein [Methanobrevibacter sp.]